MKLIIIAMLIGGSANGGAAISVHDISFSSKVSCDAAAIQIEKDGSFWKGMVDGGMYKISAVCVRD